MAAPEQVAERYWLNLGHCEPVVLKALLLGCVHALQGLHAPLMHVPLLSHAVYLQAVPIFRSLSGAAAVAACICAGVKCRT